MELTSCKTNISEFTIKDEHDEMSSLQKEFFDNYMTGSQANYKLICSLIEYYDYLINQIDAHYQIPLNKNSELIKQKEELESMCTPL